MTVSAARFGSHAGNGREDREQVCRPLSFARVCSAHSLVSAHSRQLGLQRLARKLHEAREPLYDLRRGGLARGREPQRQVVQVVPGRRLVDELADEGGQVSLE